MSNQEQLSTVITIFEQWRSNKNGQREAISEHLRQQAVLLLVHCSSSAITSALRISSAQLKQWRGLLAPDNTEFVNLTLVTEKHFGKLRSS
ncbi:MAG: hypothetical protein ABJD02_00525 [Paraglaciecola sp.]|uniref:hypothetical protein n=1 Tax=Paraglaciecola sp. TaxID=1920173 RepID=UPI0032661431